MTLFPFGHATHPQWAMAARLVLTQLRAQINSPDYAQHPTLGLLYITDHFAAHADDLLAYLGAELPEITDWVGTTGVGIASNNVEYFDEPALALMLCEFDPGSYRVYSGVTPMPANFRAQTALVHADPSTPDLGELIVEMAQRTASQQVFGGLSASRGRSIQFASSAEGTIPGQGRSNGVFDGGLSGVAFNAQVAITSRITQGCLPLAPPMVVTEARNNLVLALDGQPALDVLMKTLQISLGQAEALPAIRATLVGLGADLSDKGSTASARLVGPTGHFVDSVRVRHIIGLDPQRKGVAIAQPVQAGMSLAFCRRDAQAARADLRRVCAEVREALEPQDQSLAVASALAGTPAESSAQAARGVAGAIYISCAGRGGPHFGSDSAELQIVRSALGDVPLVGFFAAGEIAHQQIYGYTGVLTVFTHRQAENAGDHQGA